MVELSTILPKINLDQHLVQRFDGKMGKVNGSVEEPEIRKALEGGKTEVVTLSSGTYQISAPNGILIVEIFTPTEAAAPSVQETPNHPSRKLTTREEIERQYEYFKQIFRGLPSFMDRSEWTDFVQTQKEPDGAMVIKPRALESFLQNKLEPFGIEIAPEGYNAIFGKLALSLSALSDRLDQIRRYYLPAEQGEIFSVLESHNVIVRPADTARFSKENLDELAKSHEFDNDLERAISALEKIHEHEGMAELSDWRSVVNDLRQDPPKKRDWDKELRDLPYFDEIIELLLNSAQSRFRQYCEVKKITLDDTLNFKDTQVQEGYYNLFRHFMKNDGLGVDLPNPLLSQPTPFFSRAWWQGYKFIIDARALKRYAKKQDQESAGKDAAAPSAQ